jgi:hypothetical protein
MEGEQDRQCEVCWGLLVYKDLTSLCLGVSTPAQRLFSSRRTTTSPVSGLAFGASVAPSEGCGARVLAGAGLEYDGLPHRPLGLVFEKARWMLECGRRFSVRWAQHVQDLFRKEH